MGVASGHGEQEVGVASGSGWNRWVWLLGVVVRRYIDFLILLIPTPLVYICSFFTAASLLFVHLKKCFSFLFQYFFIITFYVLNNFFAQYKHIPATTGVPRRVNACHVDYVYERPETPTCEVPSNGVVEIYAYCQSVLVKLRFRLGPVTQKPLAHCTTR